MIRETCSCGATTQVDYGGDATFGSTDEARAVTTWRETHRHEPKVAPDYEGLWRDAFETVLTAAQGLADEPPAPECDHVWDRGTPDFPTFGKCAKCGVPEPIEATFTVPADGGKLVFHPENADGNIPCSALPVHEHDWDPGPKDFHGPARCRTCGLVAAGGGWLMHQAAEAAHASSEATKAAVRAAAQHTGGNAEDCPACRDRKDLPYPFICDGGKRA